MMMNPTVQARSQAEVNDFLAKEHRLPTLHDQGAFPYLACVAKEVLRCVPPGPIGLFHCTFKADSCSIPRDLREQSARSARMRFRVRSARLCRVCASSLLNIHAADEDTSQHFAETSIRIQMTRMEERSNRKLDSLQRMSSFR
ncbi:hypothetical protein DFH09DRAFT_1119370 [Mycena vulgaris]|nr:hypothetical protein DFH09DRAFT_1119370 [Mycena vulgaris]